MAVKSVTEIERRAKIRKLESEIDVHKVNIAKNTDAVREKKALVKTLKANK